MKRIRIGITVASVIEDGIAALWLSGINPNIVILAKLLESLEEVEQVVLVSYPDKPGPHPMAHICGLTSASFSDVIECLDILIELGIRPSLAESAAFRARGGRLVSYVAGNVMAINFESLANNTAHGEIVEHAGFDAAWITPQHWRMNRSYVALTRTPNIFEAPHIWHPFVVEMLRRAFEAKPHIQPVPPWRIGIFEPTINVLKTFHIPALVCDQAFRQRPDLIERVLMFSAEQLKPNIHFQEFCNALNLTRSGKLFAESRHPLAQVLGMHIDAVVAHQWENSLNYLYWDVLHLGFPLIHNSPDIKDAGYFYPEFDPINGGAVLIDALERHVQDRHYKARAKEAIWRYHIDNPALRSRYRDLLSALMDSE